MRAKIFMHQFVAHFFNYVSAKYYLNWFTVEKVIAKIIRVNFLLRHSVCCFSVFCVFLIALAYNLLPILVK